MKLKFVDVEMESTGQGIYDEIAASFGCMYLYQFRWGGNICLKMYVKWPQGYKKIMLNSAELENFHAHKC